jgi:hypothetical protein
LDGFIAKDYEIDVVEPSQPDEEEEEEEEDVLADVLHSSKGSTKKPRFDRPRSPDPTLDEFTISAASMKNSFPIYVQFLVSCCLDETFLKTSHDPNGNFFTDSLDTT